MEEDEILRETDNPVQNQEAVIKKIKKLEDFLKLKFASNWQSVRKAFLDLDCDNDGYISVEGRT